MLLRAAEMAYGKGLTALVELAGPAAGLTRLADVYLEDLSESDDCAHVAIQWEAIGADGELFTALIADLMLVPAGDQITALSLTGAYWPPPGRAARQSRQGDRALLCHGGDRQLPGLGGLRARPSRGHGRACRLLPGP